MSEPDKLWEAIRTSPFIGVYISELYWLADHVEAECKAIFDNLRRSTKRSAEYIRVDHSLHQRIFGVLLAGARIRALVRTRTRRASKLQQDVLTHRTNDLQELLEGIDLSPVLDAAARNSIEHFDEYLDDTAIESVRESIPRPTLFAVDMVVSTRRLLDRFEIGGEIPTTYFIRAYIADERVFANCGRELKLEPLRDCCGEIRTRVEPLLPDFARDEHASSMLVVTADTFAEGT